MSKRLNNFHKLNFIKDYYYYLANDKKEFDEMIKFSIKSFYSKLEKKYIIDFMIKFTYLFDNESERKEFIDDVRKI